MPIGLETIGSKAFSNCSSLSDVTVPEGVTLVGESAFESCNGLLVISLPSTLTYLGDNAFGSCWNLHIINVAQGNAVYASVDGVLYNHDLTTLVSCPKGKTGVLTIPEGVTAIGNWGVAQCEGLTEVNLPVTLVSLGDMALYGTRNISQIRIPAGVTSMGRTAFGNCYGLRNIYCHVAEALPADSYTFSGIGPWNVTLYVPPTSVEAYSNAEIWKLFNIRPLGDVDGDSSINIGDVTDLIDLLLSGDAASGEADVDGDGNVSISDVTSLIDIILTL